MARRPIVPITQEMLVRSAGNVDYKPRYWGPGVAEDWHGGDVGNDVDVNAATQAVVNRGSIEIEEDYEPQHQEEKAEDTGNTLAVDIGLDYGAHAGETGRQGTIGPRDPYPTAAGAPPPELDPQLVLKDETAPPGFLE